MLKIFSSKKTDFNLLDNLLYVLRPNGTEETALETFDFESRDSSIVPIKHSMRDGGFFVLDENCIYLIDNGTASLVVADRLSGEVLTRISLKSLCVTKPVQTDTHLYLLCVLPTRVQSLKFSTYFILEVEKSNFATKRHSSRFFSPTKSLFLRGGLLHFADEDALMCVDLSFKEKWKIRLKAKSDRMTFSDRHILVSSKDGALQCFSLDGSNDGLNLFNLQLPKSDIAPQIFDGSVLWLTNDTLYKVHIDKIAKRNSGWQEKIKHNVPDALCFYFNEDLFVGNMLGEVCRGDVVHKISNEPIVSLFSNNRILLCESATEIYAYRL